MSRQGGMGTPSRSGRVACEIAIVQAWRCHDPFLAIVVGRRAAPARRARDMVRRAHQIGRASCRERVCPYVLISGVAVSLKKKKMIKTFHYLITNIKSIFQILAFYDLSIHEVTSTKHT